MPPGRPAGCEIKVAYSYDENQRVQAHVSDERSGRTREVRISYEGLGVLGDEAIREQTAAFENLVIE